MTRLYTLLGEGSSDRVLIPLIDRSLTHCGADGAWQGEFVRCQAGEGLPEAIERACRDFPCDVLFVHRDADRVGAEVRRTEIQGASGVAPVCVVPVERTETWLLVDEQAIRTAAARRHGTATLDLPRLANLERRSGTKELLLDCLKQASELRGRRLDAFVRDRIDVMYRLAQEIAEGDGFENLRRLPSFARLQDDIRAVMERLV